MVQDEEATAEAREEARRRKFASRAIIREQKERDSKAARLRREEATYALLPAPESMPLCDCGLHLTFECVPPMIDSEGYTKMGCNRCGITRIVHFKSEAFPRQYETSWAAYS